MGEKALKTPEWVQRILDTEGLSDWTCRVDGGGCGLCLLKTREILIGEKHWDKAGMWLHEIAHAVLGQQDNRTYHDAIFADKFTELVDKYCTRRPEQEEK